MINSREISELKPEVELLCLEWLARCRREGLRVQVICTYRDNEYQDYLYSQGRATRGKIVTSARGGQSAHNHRLAWDFCMIKNGKADWNDIDGYTKAGQIAEGLNLVWGGRWKMRDYGHIEYKESLNMPDTNLLNSAKNAVKKVAEPVEKVTPKPVKDVVKGLWRSRVFWSAVASVATVINPTVGRAVTLLSNLFLGMGG